MSLDSSQPQPGLEDRRRCHEARPPRSHRPRGRRMTQACRVQRALPPGAAPGTSTLLTYGGGVQMADGVVGNVHWTMRISLLRKEGKWLRNVHNRTRVDLKLIGEPCILSAKTQLSFYYQSSGRVQPTECHLSNVIVY